MLVLLTPRPALSIPQLSGAFPPASVTATNQHRPEPQQAPYQLTVVSSPAITYQQQQRVREAQLEGEHILAHQIEDQTRQIEEQTARLQLLKEQRHASEVRSPVPDEARPSYATTITP